MKSFLPLALIIAASVAAADPPSAGYDKTTANTDTYTGSAPTILGPLAQDWVSAHGAGSGGHRIGLATPHGPPQGKLDPHLQSFLEGRLAFAFLTREIAEADLATFRKAHGREPVILSVAGGSWHRFGYVDPVVVIVHESNPLASLSFAQIDAIFSATRRRGHAAITDWGDAGVAAWRGRPVHLAGGGGWSGEESARALTMRRHVLSAKGKRGAWRPAPDSGGEADVVERVRKDPLAIGFTGGGHLESGVRAVAIAARAGEQPVLPTEAAVAGGDYPLARPVQLLLAPGPNGCVDRRLSDFAAFVIGAEGQAVIGRQPPFLPLTEVQVAASRAALRAATCSGDRVRN